MTIKILDKLVSAYYIFSLVTGIIFAEEILSTLTGAANNPLFEDVINALTFSPLGLGYVGLIVLILMVIPLELLEYRKWKHSRALRLVFHIMVIISMFVPLMYALYMLPIEIDLKVLSRIIESSWDKILVGSISLLALLLYVYEQVQCNKTLQNIQATNTPEFLN
jgi:hypothetical protein